MSDAVRAAEGPYSIDVEEGKAYFWCSCGRSASQPFCDGSHSGTTFTPVKYEAQSDRTVYFCGCKATKKSPMCDGSHSAS